VASSALAAGTGPDAPGPRPATEVILLVDDEDDMRAFIRESLEDAGYTVREDPIEFVHARKQSVVSQREVGVDTESHEVALQTALRQSPDVIFVGELHARDTVTTALRAAESGHLVLATLHASSSAGAVEQLLGLFPVDARDRLLMQLSLVLRAVIAQRLVPRSDGKGPVAAVEVVLNTPRVQALLRRGELELWVQAAGDGGVDGSRTLDQALLTLYQQRKISQDDALRFADSPDALRLWIKGIQ
jgi:twitching motility protein PilU